MENNVIRQERGWAGHHICSCDCMFRRNTLLTYGNKKIVVSTVGILSINGKIETVGSGRYFETRAFHADKKDTRFFDADVSKEFRFKGEWFISERDADDKANEMHEDIVLEITNKLFKPNNKKKISDITKP